nr:hypothetical protein [Myxococcales bacterium]
GESAPPTGTLALVSEQPDAPQAWAVRTDGTQPQPLADLPGLEFVGAPDPRGGGVAVISTEDGPAGHVEQLWRVPLDGSAAVRLDARAQMVRNPAWAPGGSHLVVETNAHSFRDLYRVPSDGSPATRLTQHPHGSFEPHVAPDGRIAFASSRDGNAEIYAMRPDGTDVVRLTTDPGDDMRPRFAPDGSALLWLARRSDQVSVWHMRPDGSEARPLRSPTPGELDVDYAWSPTSTHVAVVVRRAPDPQHAPDLDIEVVEVRSGRRVAVHGGSGLQEHPSWSPDGTWLAFTSGSRARAQVMVAPRDGGERRAVTAGGNPEWLPRWTRE